MVLGIDAARKRRGRLRHREYWTNGTQVTNRTHRIIAPQVSLVLLVTPAFAQKMPSSFRHSRAGGNLAIRPEEECDDGQNMQLRILDSRLRGMTVRFSQHTLDYLCKAGRTGPSLSSRRRNFFRVGAVGSMQVQFNGMTFSESQFCSGDF
jgi:hypothetical protein